jgi:hypothetical protein
MKLLKTLNASVTDGHETSVKDAGAHQQVNMKMVQNVLLIWLDTNIDEENSADCRNTITQLQYVANISQRFDLFLKN